MRSFISRWEYLRQFGLRASLLPAGVFLIALAVRNARVEHDDFIATWGDDFYYYLKVAMNVVAGHGSSFDGQTVTNGYHPLWMACVIGLVALLGGGKVMLATVGVIVALSTTFTFVYARRLAAWASGVDGVSAIVIGLYAALFSYKVGGDGMEVVLTVPLLLSVVVRMISQRDQFDSARSIVVTGALCSLLVLSRLDSILYVALLLLSQRLYAGFSLGSVARHAGLFALGFAPCLLYFSYNLLVFGAPLPVSGAAKQLAEWPILYVQAPVLRAMPFQLFLEYPSKLLLLIAAILFVRKTPPFDPAARHMVVMPLLAFPPLYYAAQAALSDWEIYRWYLYPLVGTTPLAMGMVIGALRRGPVRVARVQPASPPSWFENKMSGWALTVAWMTVLGAAIAIGAYQTTRAPRVPPKQMFARVIEEFAKTHPGRYAMGDRAGVVGYLLPHSLLQLEGLVEDRRFLEHIKNREDLVKVLESYDVDYYAASFPRRVGSCFETVEPFKGGPASPRMVGRFCQPPLLVHTDPSDSAETVIFKVSGAKRVAQK